MQSVRWATRWVAIIGVSLVGGGGVAVSPAGAISSDYCGSLLSSGSQCWEGSGYRGWRYHQASSDGVVLPNICAWAWTGANYRTGSGCNASSTFYAFAYCSAEPTANSSVGWNGGTGTRRIYGHADSRTCSSFAASQLPRDLRERLLEDPVAMLAGVDVDSVSVRVSGAAGTVLKVDGDTRQCIVLAHEEGWSIGCTDLLQVARDTGMQVAAIVDGDAWLVYGIGKPGSTLSIKTDDGSSSEVGVSDEGGFVQRTTGRPAALTDGTVTMDLL